MQTIPALVLIALFAGAAAAATLDDVKGRGVLACGVVRAAPDWTKDDFHGDLSALGSEICKAAGAAVLGNPEAARIAWFPAEADALRALHAGRVDALAGVTPGVSRGQQYQAVFGPVIFWDSQGVLLHAAGIKASMATLAGRTLCYLDGTDAAATLLSARSARGWRFMPFPFQEQGEMEAGLIGGHCAGVSASVSALAGMRAEIGHAGDDLVLLPDVLSVVPLAVATRAGDAVWSEVIGAVVDVLVLAEMQGVTKANVDTMRQDGDAITRHLLGAEWSAAMALGLARDFGAREIMAVGDYGAVFDRTIGMSLPRGMNAVCTGGGAICAAPLR